MAGFNNDTMYADNVDFTGSTTPTPQVTTNGQLLIGSTVAPNIRVGNLTSTGATVNITNGAGTINLEVASPFTATTYQADSGSATPAANILNVLGGPGVTTTGVGNTLTINSVVFTDQAGSTTVSRDSGSFATAAITLSTPLSPAQGELLEFVATSASALVIDAQGTQLIRMGSLVSSAGGTATSTAIGDAVKLRYRSADTTWYAISVIGTWVLA